MNDRKTDKTIYRKDAQSRINNLTNVNSEQNPIFPTPKRYEL